MPLATRKFEDLLNLTRASGKWEWNDAGVLVPYADDVPAFSHNPLTGEPEGILVERSAVNHRTDSFAPVNWSNHPNFTKTTGLADIRGGASAVEYFANENTTLAPALMSISEVGQGFGCHVVCKPGNTDQFTFAVRNFTKAALLTPCAFTFSTETFSNSKGLGFTKLNNGFYLLEFYEPTTPGSWDIGDGIQIYFSPSSGTTHVAGDSIIYDSAFLSRGQPASSPIETGASSATRAVDNLDLILGNWFNPSKGAFYIEFDLLSLVGDGNAHSIISGNSPLTGERRYFGPRTSNNTWIVQMFNGGAGSQIDFPNAGDYLGNHKAVFAWQHNVNFYLALDGVFQERTTATTALFDSDSALLVGHSNSGLPPNRPNMKVKALRYYPEPPSQAEAEALTL